MKNSSSLPGLVVLLALVGCGGSAATAEPSADGRARGGAETSPSRPSDSLSRHELAKLDDRLRDRVEANAHEGVFPVRVKFLSRPSPDELTALFLVAYERDAIGRVDRATLKSIAARADVQLISFVDGAGYGDSEDGEAPDDLQDDARDDDFGVD